MKLKNKVIAITGASGVIGKYIALAAAKEGASLALTSRSESGLNGAESFIRERVGSSAKILTRTCDVTSDESVQSTFALIEKEMGPVDGLVTAAGLYGAIGSFAEVDLHAWREGLETNLYGTLRAIKAVLPSMMRRRSGRIILFSGGGQGAMPRFSSYVSGKGAIWRLTETLAAEFVEHGIYLNAIAPGPVKSQFLQDLIAAGPEKVGRDRYEDSLRQLEQEGPSPEKAGDLALHLLSDWGVGVYGKTVSALYDRYSEIENPSSLSKTDVFTMRRVVSKDGATRYPDR